MEIIATISDAVVKWVTPLPHVVMVTVMKEDTFFNATLSFIVVISIIAVNQVFSFSE